jgi:hypothetical protein
MGVVALGTVSVASVPAWRHSLLRTAGWTLVAQDAPSKADIIVVSSDSSSAGMLEAADLVKAGFASRVAIFDRRDTVLQQELARRGAVVGTVDEGRVLQQWCAANSVHSLLFISVTDHSRRTRRVLDRALGRQGVRVMVRYARWSQFDPDAWWQSRYGQRTQIMESEKLLVDILRHPF